jgi:hypothetical protein
VIHPVAITIDDRLLEPDDVDEETDRHRPRIARSSADGKQDSPRAVNLIVILLACAAEVAVADLRRELDTTDVSRPTNVATVEFTARPQ